MPVLGFEGSRILLVDDDRDSLFTVSDLLAHEGFQVQTAENGLMGLRAAEKYNPDVILSDVMMPEMTGLEFVRALRDHSVLRYTPVLLLTSKDSEEDIVLGLEAGADDYLAKPFKSAELLARLKSALATKALYQELQRSHEENARLKSNLAERSSYHDIIGESPAIQVVFDLIHKVKDAELPVLITGESGTGKELVARAIHFSGARKEKPFVVQNCAAFQENLLESELFGHARGAFTGATREKEGLFMAANGGTFFLDELGEMSLSLQVKLLRVLQEGTFLPVGSTEERKVDVRIVAATNRDLRAMMAEGTFRDDLYYRLNVVNIALPPLRERARDVSLLLDFFLKKSIKKQGAREKKLSEEIRRKLLGYHWPGNIRELQNEIERVVLLSGADEVISDTWLSPHVAPGSYTEPLSRDRSEHRTLQGTEGTQIDLKDELARVERSIILGALEKSGGNKSEAAKAIGISRSSLIAKVQSYEEEG